MAIISTVNTSDKTLILASKEGFRRQGSIGTNWTQVRIGCFYTVVPSGNDDAAFGLETVTQNVIGKDDLTFGLCDAASGGAFTTSSRFVGIRNHGNYTQDITNVSGAGRIWGQGSLMLASASNGTSEIHGSGHSFSLGYPQFSTTGVAFHAIQFTVVNAGASSQTVNLKVITASSSITDVSTTNLKSLILGGTYSNLTDVTFNSGGSALTLPDCFWIRIPAVNHRLRISAYSIIRIV